MEFHYVIKNEAMKRLQNLIRYKRVVYNKIIFFSIHKEYIATKNFIEFEGKKVIKWNLVREGT